MLKLESSHINGTPFDAHADTGDKESWLKTPPCASLSFMQIEATQPTPPAGTDQCPLITEHHSVYCPTCSSRLTDSRCKLICRTCGYFLSCADFY
jgi:hypothetical protein